MKISASRLLVVDIVSVALLLLMKVVRVGCLDGCIFLLRGCEHLVDVVLGSPCQRCAPSLLCTAGWRKTHRKPCHNFPVSERVQLGPARSIWARETNLETTHVTTRGIGGRHGSATLHSPALSSATTNRCAQAKTSSGKTVLRGHSRSQQQV